MKVTAEIFLCNYLKCSREHLQNEISRNPTKVIKAMETYADIFNKERKQSHLIKKVIE